MFSDHSINIARQMGSYQAIAQMMAESIRELDSSDEFTRDWARNRLVSLAEQFEETVEKYQKEVDMA